MKRMNMVYVREIVLDRVVQPSIDVPSPDLTSRGKMDSNPYPRCL